VCLAIGKVFLGFRIPKPLRVLYVDAESSPALLARRWDSLKCLLKDNEIMQVKQNLTVIQGRQLIAEGHSISIDSDSPGYRTLSSFIKTCKVDLIVIDPLRVFHSADEDRSGAMTGVLSEIRRLALGKTVIVIHHCRKRPGSAQKTLHLKDDPYAWSDNLRGSNVLKAQADGIILQEIMADTDGEERFLFAAILKDNPNVAPMVLIESQQSPFWFDRVADQSVKAATDLLNGRDQEIYRLICNFLKARRVARPVEIAEHLIAVDVPRSTAFKKIQHLGRIGLLDCQDDAVALLMDP